MKNTLVDFQEWQAAEPTRSVTIKIQNTISTDEPQTTMWVYDTKLMAGQYIQSVDEIDLEAEKEKEERAALDKLTRKYGGKP